MNNHSTVRADNPNLVPLVPLGSDFDLRGYLRTMFAARVLLLAAAVIGALVGLALAWLSTPMYRSTSTLAVSQSKIGEQGFGGAATAASFLPLVRNYNTAVSVIQKFKLDAAPYNLTPSAFLERTLTVTEIRNTNLLVASVVLPDRQLAANVVNEVAAASIALSNRLNQEEAIRGRDIVGKQITNLHARLQDTEMRLLRYKNDSQLELLRGEVDTLVEQNSWLPRLSVTIASERARLAKAEEQRGLRQAPDADKGAGGGATGVPDVSLDEAIARGRADVAALERERAELLRTYRLGAGQLAKLRELNEKEAALARLQLEYDLTKTAYTAAAEQFANATLQVASRSAELQVIDPGFPADRPFSPRPMRSMLMWMVIGVVIAATGILLSTSFRATPGPAR